MTTALDRTTLRRACNLAERALSGVGDEQLSGPTPCSEWTVQQVMTHVVSATDFFADVAELGASPDGRTWPEYAPEDLAPSFTRHSVRLLAGFDDEGALDRPMRLPTGETTGHQAIEVAIAELFIHSWDLATATNQSFGEDDIADALLSSDYMALCAQVRNDPSVPFAPVVPIADNAPPVDRLMAFLGRDPGFAAR